MKILSEGAQRDREVRSKFLLPSWDGEQYIETVCLTCNDLHWVIWQDKSFPCPDCSKFDRTANMLKYSGIVKAVQCQRFESFKPVAGTKEALEAAKILTADPQMDSSEVFLVMLYGGPGCGKTHLAHASGMAAIDKGWPVRFVICGELLREFKAAKSLNDGQAKYSELFTGYVECPYLILDELNWSTDADIRMIDDLLCEREANHLMTFVTTNRNLGEMEEALPRVMSRFKDKRFARLVFNQGSDYRRRIK